MHRVVLHGYQGADFHAEQLALTEQLFDAALGERGVVARGQLCLVVGDFNVEPTNIPFLLEGIMAGLWVDLETAWAGELGAQPAVTCKRTWCSTGSNRRDFMGRVSCDHCCGSFICIVEQGWCLQSHLSVKSFVDCQRWTCGVTQPIWRTRL